MMKKTDPYTAGEFRNPVQVQRVVETPDGSGGFTKTWPVHIPVMMCAVENKRGREPYGDKDKGRIRTEQLMVFTTWYRSDITQTDRLLFDGILYNIRQVNDLDLRKKFLQIVAEAGVEQ